MLIEYDIEGNKIDKVQIAIDMLRALEPEDGYYVAFSGGKDSQCVAELCRMAGVKHELHYSLTTVDPPELVQFIKEQYPEAWENQHVEYWPDTGEAITMWNLIPRKRMPPTRVARYCCDVLNETGGSGRVTVTGVRWAESVSRRANQGAVTITGVGKKDAKKLENIGVNFTQTVGGGVALNYDNDTTKDAIEMCYRRRKTLVNPIIAWEDEDVWEFLNNVAKVPHCKLYDRGWTRLGCIGCPMSANREHELDAYPAFKRAYMSAFTRMLRERERAGLPNKEWQDADAVMQWWVTRRKGEKPDKNQISMFDGDEADDN